MALFGPAYQRLGPTGLARALDTLGVRLPAGRNAGDLISERWLREAANPRTRTNMKAAQATAREHRAYVASQLKGTSLHELEIASQGGGNVRGGAHVLKDAKRNKAKFVGTEDRHNDRGEVTFTASKEVTKAELKRLLTSSGLPAGDWVVRVFGIYLTTEEGGSPPSIGTNRRHISSVQGAKELMRLFGEVEGEITELQKAAYQATIDAAKAEGRIATVAERRKAEQRITEGDPSDPESYPSFAARWATNVTGYQFVRVFAVSVGLAR